MRGSGDGGSANGGSSGDSGVVVASVARDEGGNLFAEFSFAFSCEYAHVHGIVLS